MASVRSMKVCDGPTAKMRPGQGQSSSPRPPISSTVTANHVRAMVPGWQARSSRCVLDVARQPEVSAKGQEFVSTSEHVHKWTRQRHTGPIQRSLDFSSESGHPTSIRPLTEVRGRLNPRAGGDGPLHEWAARARISRGMGDGHDQRLRHGRIARTRSPVRGSRGSTQSHRPPRVLWKMANTTEQMRSASWVPGWRCRRTGMRPGRWRHLGQWLGSLSPAARFERVCPVPVVQGMFHAASENWTRSLHRT